MVGHTRDDDNNTSGSQKFSLFVVLIEHMPLARAGICCCLLVLEVGEALVEVVLGMPSLGELFALGLGGGADENLHADLALSGRNFRYEIKLAKGRLQFRSQMNNKQLLNSKLS